MNDPRYQLAGNGDRDKQTGRAGSSTGTTIPATTDEAAHLTRAEYVRRLLRLGECHGEIPIYGSLEWEALPSTDPRRFASVVRAAECWRLDGEPDAMRWRLAEDDLLIAVRTRLASGDLAEWPFERHHETARARAEAGDPRYRRAA